MTKKIFNYTRDQQYININKYIILRLLQEKQLIL